MLTFLSRLAACMVLLISPFALALKSEPYSEQALAEAQANNQAVVLHFHADWCGSCKIQSMVFETLRKEGGVQAKVLVVDYDKAQGMKDRFKVKTQSTIVVFKGRIETSRLVGETRESRIRAALVAAL